jgi:hypothetical protein
MRKPMPWSATISLSVCAFIVLNACGAASATQVVTGVSTIPTVRAPDPLPPYVRTVSHAQTLSLSQDSNVSSQTIDVRADCAANEVPIAGGFNFQESGNTTLNGASATASLRDGNGWTVRIVFHGTVPVTVDAQCLGRAPGTVSVQTANVDFSSAGQVAGGIALCPAGSMVLGGGFVVQNGVVLVNNYPTDHISNSTSTSGWVGAFKTFNTTPQLAGASVTASCYSVARPVSMVTDHRVTTSTVSIGKPGDNPDVVYISNLLTFCPAGTTLTAGGYTLSAGTGSVRSDAPDGTGWQVGINSVNAPPNGLAAVVECVTF